MIPHSVLCKVAENFDILVLSLAFILGTKKIVEVI